MSTFSIRLRGLRKERKETQEEVGRLMGLNKSTFSAYERGIIVPPYDKISYLANHYQVSVDYLMGTTNFRIPSDRKLNDDGILDVRKHLEIIREELGSSVSVVKIGTKELDPEEKKMMGMAIDGALTTATLIGGSHVGSDCTKERK